MFNLKLERYLLGELPKAEMARMEKELKKNPELRARLERLKGDTAAYFAKYPTLQSKKAEPWWQRRITRVMAGGFAFAAAAVFAVMLLPRGQSEPVKIALNGNDPEIKIPQGNLPGENEIRTKGLEPALFLSAGDRSLKNGDAVKAGDAIQIAYRASGFVYGAILSVDADRSVTQHFPENPDGVQKLEKGKRSALQEAFELDEKPGSEKFFFIASQKRIPVAKLRRELQKTGTLSIPKTAETHLTMIELRKP